MSQTNSLSSHLVVLLAVLPVVLVLAVVALHDLGCPVVAHVHLEALLVVHLEVDLVVHLVVLSLEVHLVLVALLVREVHLVVYLLDHAICVHHCGHVCLVVAVSQRDDHFVPVVIV